jgi:gas vesicle protein
MSVSTISPNQTLPSLKPGEMGEADNVDRIRDILFGNQMRDYDTKLSRLEERWAKDATELRDDVKRRLASLDSYVKGELSEATERARVEVEEKTQTIKTLGTELKEHINAWEKKNHQLEVQDEKAHRELREQILNEANRLGEEILQKTKDLAAALSRESSQIHDTLASRQELAELFAQWALHFRGETSDKREK